MEGRAKPHNVSKRAEDSLVPRPSMPRPDTRADETRLRSSRDEHKKIYLFVVVYILLMQINLVVNSVVCLL